MTIPPPDDATGDAVALAERLATIGLNVVVEPIGGGAILRPSLPHIPPIDAAMRRAIVRAARGCGFSTVALEVDAPNAHHEDAALPGAEPIR